MIHNKLVRDNIPEIIKADNHIPITRILDDDEYRDELARKLIEEANEYTKDRNLVELADVLEVVRALIATHGASHEEVEKLRAERAEKRGGFAKRIFLVEDKEAHV